MAPKELIGRYKLYKSKTKGLLYWLTRTAGTCTDLSAIIKSLTVFSPSSNATAKTAKTAKIAKERQYAEHVNTAELKISTAELVRLAEAIAKAEPAVEIPNGVILIVEDVIKGREDCAEWYSAQVLEGGGKVEKENEGHRYFILVLRKILALLKAARGRFYSARDSAASAKPSGGKKGKKTNFEDGSLGGLFACLQLEEPGEHALGDGVPTQVTDTPTGRRNVVFDLEKGDEDFPFEHWCFLQDLGDVRNFVRQAWEEYGRGDISLLAASSITDTAFGLLRCADEDFAQVSSLKSSDWNCIISYLELLWFVRGRAVWLCPDPNIQATQPRIPDSETNIVELLCHLAFLCLKSYQQDAGLVCQHYKSARGTADGSHPIVECHVNHIHDICCVFGNLAPGLYHISHCTGHDHRLVDEFVQGLATLHHRREFPMWLVVACQIYLDIYDLLGDHLDHGVQALSDTFSRNVQVARDVAEYQSGCGDMMGDVVSALARLQWIAAAAIRFDATVNDPIEGIDSAKQLQVREEVGCSASTMERSLPAYAGALLTDIKVGLHEVGCCITNHNAIVLSAAHLYKALRAMRVLDVDWHDMEFVLASFCTKQPLVAKPGGQYDGEAAGRHYLIALGMSAQEFAADARGRKKLPIDAKKVPQITVTSTLLRALCDRQNSWQRNGIGHTKSRMIEAVLHALTDHVDKDNKRKSGADSHSRPVFTPRELLATFKERLLHDEPLLNFDFTSFTLSCARLLRLVATTLQPILSLGSEHTESHFHFALISRLLHSHRTSKAIESATSLLRSHIEIQGKANIKRAYDQSSGRIPRALRPQIPENQARESARRELVKTIFDTSRTKYSFSGPLVAAYHPGIKPEVCCTQANCRESFPPSGETDPELEENGGRNVGGFGSALPKAIVELSRERIGEGKSWQRVLAATT